MPICRSPASCEMILPGVTRPRHSFQGLANLAQTDRRIATMLRDGRFDVSALDQERLTEILGEIHAIRNGDRIVIQPDSDD